MGLLELLVTLIILCVVIYAIYTVLGVIPLPPPIKTLVYLLVGVIMLLYILDKLGIYHAAL